MSAQYERYLMIVDEFWQISDGLSFLEKKKMVHRDIRAANILVGDNYLCKIADFGLAQFKWEAENNRTSSSYIDLISSYSQSLSSINGRLGPPLSVYNITIQYIHRRLHVLK